MALEDLTGTKYLDDLNASNPAAGDNVSEGDDHIRGIKNVLKLTFPNVDAAVNATPTELNYVDGVTSAIQTQLGTKAPLASPTFTGTVAIPNVANLETAVVANTAKVSNVTHTGDVTGATALTIAVDAVDIAMLSATGTASGTTFLRGDNTWDVPIGGVTSVNSVTGAVTAANIATAVEAASDSNTFTDADHTKLNAVAASANNYVHPNHSGEVTSTADGATVLVDNIVDEANLKSDNSPTNDYVLTAKSSAAGGLTWAEIESGNTTANPMWEMAHTVSSNYVMTTNYNGVSVAPVTINSSISVTVPSGSTWTIV